MNMAVSLLFDKAYPCYSCRSAVSSWHFRIHVMGTKVNGSARFTWPMYFVPTYPPLYDLRVAALGTPSCLRVSKSKEAGRFPNECLVQYHPKPGRYCSVILVP